MSKKVIATIVVLLMLLSTVSVMSTAQVPKAQAQGACDPGVLCVFLRPGVADPDKPGFSLTLGTLRNNEQLVIQQQNEFAVLIGSTGDLQFDITVVQPIGYIEIWVPPGFEFAHKHGGPESKQGTEDLTMSIWTDITNDYGYIAVSHRSATDGIGPNWHRIRIGQHKTSTGALATTKSPMYDNLVIEPGLYHVRLFSVTAPAQAGLYHFKIGTDLGLEPVENWPIMIVKAELNPAYIEGVVTTGISGLSGKIIANGTTSAGTSVSGVAWFSKEDECPNLGDASTACGPDADTVGAYHYILFGLAPGDYSITSMASGFGADVESRFTVAAGQSAHIYDVGLSLGAKVTVHVFSKHGRGTIPWGCLWQPPFGTNDYTTPPNDCGTVVNLNGDTVSRVRDILVTMNDSAGNLVGWWGSDNYAAFEGIRQMGGTIQPTDPTATDYSMPLLDQRGLPSIMWEGVPSSSADFISGYLSQTYNVGAFVTGYIMTPNDAFQRTFSISKIANSTSVEMDLRRTNWFVIVAHGVEPKGPLDMTLAYAAVPTGTTPAAGGESGLAAIALPAGTNAESTPVILEGWAEGWTGTGPGAYANDYGLVPGTYDIKMMAADEGSPLTGEVGNGIYYIRAGEPFTGTIAECNSPVFLSFRTGVILLTLTIRSIDTEVPAHERPWTFPGSEFWLNFVDSTGNVAASLDPTEIGSASSISYGLVQDNGLIGSPWDSDTVHPVGEHSRLTITWAGVNPAPVDVINGGLYPTVLQPGQYNFQIKTDGYVMSPHIFPVWITDRGFGDIQADLIQGGSIRVALEFKKEAVAVNFNGFVRIEVHNSTGGLVGASIYGMAQPNVCTTVSPTADTGCTVNGNYLNYEPEHDSKIVFGPAEAANADVPPQSPADGQRAYLSHVWYGVPSKTWADWVKMDPSDANRLQYGTATANPDVTTADPEFDVYGFHWYYGQYSMRWANGWDVTDGYYNQDYGLAGSRDVPGVNGATGVKGGGLYTVTAWAFDPRGPDGVYGTADDWAAYYTATNATNVEVPWGGTTLVSYVNMNEMGRLSGEVLWSDMYGNIANMPWALISTSGSVQASLAPGAPAIGLFTYSTNQVPSDQACLTTTDPCNPDPAYMIWAPAGTHDFSVSVAGVPQVFAANSFTVAFSDGFRASTDPSLAPTGVPVPEFPATTLLALLSALSASVYLLRRRKLVKK